MEGMKEVVLIGGGLASARTAEELRTGGFEGRIRIVGDEDTIPYLRPPLSKSYLQGEVGFDGVLVHTESWYADHDVDMILANPAVEIDRHNQQVVLADGGRLRFDRVLIATGASPRRIGVPGADLDGIHYLRTVEDSDRIKAGIRAGGPVVVIGAGWIGLETAAAARLAGCDVDVLEAEDIPLGRVLGPEIAPVLVDLHREHGVRIRTGVQVAAFRGGSHVEAVALGDGSTVPAAMVIVGVGVAPNTAIGLGAGIAVDNGIIADGGLRTTDHRIFAAGDVANAWHPFYERRIRLEHWASARYQPAVVAAGMLGSDASYERLPFFYSDQYEVGLEYTGHTAPGAYDDVIVRGELADRRFIAFWLSGGVIVAAMNVNTWDVAGDLEAMVRSRQPVDPQALADSAGPLRELIDVA